MHPLLRSLFDEHIAPGTALPPGWGAFVEAVDRAWGGEGAAEPGAGEATFRVLAETISAAVFVYRGSRFRYVNAAASALTGHPVDELLRMNFWDVVHPDDRSLVRDRGLARLRGEAVPPRYEFRIVTRGGEERWVDFTSGTVEYEGRLAAVGTAFDVTERKRADDELREGEARYRALFEESRDAIYMAGEGGRFVAVNQAALELFGYGREEMLEMGLRDLCVDPTDCDRLQAEIDRAGWVRDHEVRLRRRDGGVVDCLLAASRRSGGSGDAVQGIVHDITERKRAEEQLAYGAFHDPLTGLPNRALFLDRLGQAMERVRRRGDSTLAVLFLDLDRFKVINDSLGHGTGDELLRALGARLAETLRPGDTAARFGGDEFTVLLDNVGEALTAAHVAQRILESLALPFHLGRSEVYTSASAGIALHSGGPATPEELLRNAGTALGRAKVGGRARHEVFDRAMHADALARLQMEMDLRPALERGELRLVYQPVVSLLEDGAVAGFEALLRWEHPTRGRVLPEAFVPVAEETGLIVPMGEWVLGEACRQLRVWRDRFPGRGITVGVNLSPRQFARPELVDRVREILEETGVEPSALRLEITESLLIEHADPTAAMLARLRAEGVGLCMDDFGTGYSSLSYLHRFPLDTLKIDRSFVNRVGRGGDAEPIVRTIAALAHNLGLDVVAEGVETAEQLEELRELRCEYAQGFLFSPPLDPAGVERLLADDPRW